MKDFKAGKVSVITPLYNGKESIIQTLESVRNQTYTNWEMLIIDDASTDGSADLVADYLHVLGDARILLFRNETNSGAVASRNRALQEATGQYITFLDSDDLWDPDKLETQLAFLAEKKKTDPRAGFVFGACRIIDRDGNATQKIRHVDAVGGLQNTFKRQSDPLPDGTIGPAGDRGRKNADAADRT